MNFHFPWLLLLAAAAAPVAAQHDAHPQTTDSAVAGQPTRTIKALDPREIDDLLAGRGAGSARAAELNGYPGPMHVIEHAAALRLTATQRQATEQLIGPMRDTARAQGQRLVDAERALDRLFAEGRATPALVATQLQAIGAARSAIRQAHLDAHIAQRAILTAEQIAQYNQLRGYGDTKDAATGHRHHDQPQRGAQ